MSAVVSFVSDVVESVVDAVGDVVETVVDVVEEAVEFVGDTVQAVIEDPLPTLLMIAGSAVGIPPAITSAAVTAARGGDLTDIVLSAGTSYLAPQATSAISSTLSSSIGNSIINETVSDIVVDGVSKGLVNGTIAEIRGGDFDDGFAGAFTGTIVNSSVGAFTNEFIKPEVQDMLADSGFEASTVNTIVNEGTRAVSAGITSEITGRGDFNDAFINSVQNSTINIGTNYAVNTISDQFEQAEIGLVKIEDASTEEDDRDILSVNDYFDLDTTRDTSNTGAGIPDDLVEDVEVADTSLDTGNISTTTTTNLEDEFIQTRVGDFDEVLAGTDTYDFGDVLGTGDEIIEDFVAPDQTVAEGDTVDETIDGIDLSSIDFESLPEDLRDLFDFGPATVAEADEVEAAPPQGGLAYVDQQIDPNVEESDILFTGGDSFFAPEEGVISTTATEVVPEVEDEDIYAGVADETFGLPTDGTVDVAEADIATDDGTGISDLIEGGLNKVQQGFVDATDPDKIKNTLISGALQQVVRPAIRQGLTRAIRGTPARPVARTPKPKQTLTPQQIAALRTASGAQKQTAPKKIDMSKIMAQIKNKQPTYVPPKKADVSKLTPVTDVASLSSILGGGKG